MSIHDKQQLDRLDQIALAFQSDQEERGRQMFGVLSTGERCYVALAANRPDLLPGDSIAYMVERIGVEWLEELIGRHRSDSPEYSTVADLKDENTRLRKIAAHVPGSVYIKAKEAAGYADIVKTDAELGKE